MDVYLIDYTGKGSSDPARHAANVLIFTKQTRLNMTPSLMKEIESWSEETINSELEYMSNTIPGSWEHCRYTFIINNVTRAFTHQLVRTRTGSYSQQSLRVVDVKGWDYLTGPSIKERGQLQDIYSSKMDDISLAYNDLLDLGANIEDARGILPTNILTNIVAGFDLRTLTDMFRKRASSRTQGEYRDVIEAMKVEVIRVHPWAKMFIQRTFDVAASDLERMIADNIISETNRIKMIKLLDQLRTTA